MNINQVTIKQIERLSDIQLTKLLHALLQIELCQNSIEGEAFVPFNITTGDGGDDGRIQWTNGLKKTKWLKKQFCIFQNKATTLHPKDCYREMLRSTKKSEPKALKPRIEELVKADGCYILFTNISLNSQLKADRIKNFRRAIKDTNHQNHLTIPIEIYDSNSIKDWVNENIGTIKLVQEFNGINTTGFITWDYWGKTLPGANISFKSNDITSQNINNIQEAVKNKTPIRIIGHSGIGKTRLVLEAFKAIDSDKEIIALQKQVVYYPIGLGGDLPQLYRYLTSHVKQSGILVIDNCDEKTHNALLGLIGIGKFKLITIDATSSTNEDSSIKIDRDNQRDIVKNIIDDLLGNSHSPNDRNYLNKICEGYPWMAVKFCKSIEKNGINNFSGILPQEFIQRLLFSEKNKIEYNVIRACSIFSTFGFLDDEIRPIVSEEQQLNLEEQTDFIRTIIYDGEDISKRYFYEICQKYKTEDIIEKRGTQYVVKPTILAINLASDWLLSTPPSEIIKILEKLKGKSLGVKFVERLKDLDQLDKAQQLVHDLWGPNSSFGSAKVLNTRWGSLIFRHIVEVNPQSTIKTLKAAFGKLSKEDILKIKNGRRNLVLALEKLCFRKETFRSAAKILYSFAVSENETMSNNASGQFVQLFQLFLAGTEATLEDRMKIISYGLLKNDDDYTKLAIKALKQGLYYGNFTRFGNSEQQGSKTTLIDYSPSQNEILTYWEESIKILTKLICDKSPHSKLAKEVLAYSFSSLISYLDIDIIISSVNAITLDSPWLEGYNSLKRTLRFSKKLSPNTKSKLDSLISSLIPNDLESLLYYKISKPEWDSYETDENGNEIDNSRVNAELFAEELFYKKIDWTSIFPLLLKGEQRQSFTFGKKLGELISQKKEFVESILKSLKEIPLNERNIEIIGGFLIGANQPILNTYVLNKMIENRYLNIHVFYIVRIIKPTLTNLKRLLELLDDNNVSIAHFKSFQYGRALDHFSNDEVISFVSKIATYNISGRWIALSIVFMYSFNKEENWNSCSRYVQELISEKNMLIYIPELNSLDSYHWTKSVKRLLTQKRNTQFAKIIALQIIEFCKLQKIVYSSQILIDTLKILINKYFDSIWDIIGSGIINEDPIVYSRLKNMFGGQNGNWGTPNLLFMNERNIPKIMSWVRKYPSIAPKRIANIMPLEDPNSRQGNIKWHPFSRGIIDEFGNQKKLLSMLRSNMGTYGVSGSSIPYYKKQKELIEQLLVHPIALVEEWAEEMLSYTDKRIKQEELEEEENL